MKVHELKLSAKYYHRVVGGTKKWEVRFNDRSYQRGDVVVFRLWIDHLSEYGSEWCAFVIKAVDFVTGLESDHVILSLSSEHIAGYDD